MSVMAPIKATTNNLILSLDAANIKSYIGSGTSWNDLSGNNNNSVLSNGPTFTGSFGGSIIFDGTNDTADISTIDLRTSFTYECWVNMNVVTNFSFLGQGTNSANSGLHLIHNSDTVLRFGMYANDTDFTMTATVVGTWYHYVFTYNHSSPYTKNMYRNAVQISGVTQQAQSQYAGTGTVRIGCYINGTPFSNGRFAMARIYNRILADTEILQNYNSNKSRFGL